MKVAQSCPIVCKPMACSLPGSSVHGILQARILEWVAISFSSRSSDPGIEHGSLALQAYSLLAELPGKPLKKEERKKERKWSRSVRSNFLWPHGHQAPPSMGFSRQEYWSGLPFPSPEDLPHPGWTQISCTVGRCFTIWAMLLISFPCFITVAKTSSTVLSRCNKSRQPCHIPDHKGSFLSWNYLIFCQMCFCHLLIWSDDFLKFC